MGAPQVQADHQKKARRRGEQSFDLWGSEAPKPLDLGNTGTVVEGENIPNFPQKKTDAGAAEELDNPEKSAVATVRVTRYTQNRPEDGSKKVKSAYKVSKTMHDIQTKNPIGYVNVVAGNARPSRKPQTIGKHEGTAAAVQLPPSGWSVNPGKKAMEEAVDEVVAKEVEVMREEEDEKRRKAPMTAFLSNHFTAEELKKMSLLEKQREFIRITRGEAGMTADGEAMVGDTAGEDGGSAPATGPNKKKHIAGDILTKAERNKQKRVLSQFDVEKAAKLEKEKQKAIGNASQVAKELEQEEKDKAARLEYLKALKSSDTLGKQNIKIGRTRFQEGPQLLPQVASSSLRQAHVAEAGNGTGVGSALLERVKSMQRRHMVELPPSFQADTVFRAKKKAKRVTRAVSSRQRGLEKVQKTWEREENATKERKNKQALKMLQK